MKTLIVGGNFGDTPKASSVMNKMADEFLTVNPDIINGGTLDELPHEMDSDLIIWAPNISNENAKQYPKKSKGNVLICSKVMREGYTTIDAVSRIFKMRGNAVIAIYPGEKFTFKLIDALGNVWYSGTEISGLCASILDVYKFTKDSIRVGSERKDLDDIEVNEDLSHFIEVNKSLAEHIQTSCGERFFGNISTRCSKLFPSYKHKYGVFVSPRNISKEALTPEDMVHIRYLGEEDGAVKHDGENTIYYSGVNKPSVDTPIQLMLYHYFKDIDYMVHGHAFIKDAPMTKEYFPCGDMREFGELIELMEDRKSGAVNLKNHGFIIWGDNLDGLKEIISKCEFDYKREE